jgi:uncharacterized membrane protein
VLKLIAAYGVTAIVFLVADAIWLSAVALGFYRREVGALLLERPNLAISGLFYLVFAMGIVFFAVAPNLETGNWGAAALSGAVLGLVAYGTYDITNLATLKGWSAPLSLTDLAWGTVLTAAAAGLGTVITRSLPL